jgi:teichuronic acid biosynthesis glycosyltransferase TuaC
MKMTTEAMARNCPVVATNVGDIAWLFGNEPGHFLTTFEPEDMADNLKQALVFAQVHGKTNGRDRIVLLGLDSETIALKILDVYNEIREKSK